MPRSGTNGARKRAPQGNAVNRHPLARAITCILLVAVTGGAAFAQDHTPQPYTPEEFPSWLNDLWRAEVIFVGSFPFVLFATLEVYDTYRFVTPQGSPPQTFNPSYAPWPFGSGTASPYSPQESAWLAITAVSISFIISGIDFILGHLNEPAAQQ